MSASLDGPPRFPSAPPMVRAPQPPAAWASLPRADEPTRREPRRWATLGFGAVSVTAAVFACFAPWATYADGAWRSGLDHGGGFLVLVLAVAAAGCCGAVAAGVRHLALRLAIAAIGLAVFVVFEVNRWSVDHASDQVTGASIDVGGGLYVVAFAALGLVIAALAMPSAPWWSTRSAAAPEPAPA